MSDGVKIYPKCMLQQARQVNSAFLLSKSEDKSRENGITWSLAVKMRRLRKDESCRTQKRNLCGRIQCAVLKCRFSKEGKSIGRWETIWFPNPKDLRHSNVSKWKSFTLGIGISFSMAESWKMVSGQNKWSDSSDRIWLINTMADNPDLDESQARAFNATKLGVWIRHLYSWSSVWVDSFSSVKEGKRWKTRIHSWPTSISPSRCRVWRDGNGLHLRATSFNQSTSSMSSSMFKMSDCRFEQQSKILKRGAYQMLDLRWVSCLNRLQNSNSELVYDKSIDKRRRQDGLRCLNKVGSVFSSTMHPSKVNSTNWDPKARMSTGHIRLDSLA